MGELLPYNGKKRDSHHFVRINQKDSSVQWLDKLIVAIVSHQFGESKSN